MQLRSLFTIVFCSALLIHQWVLPFYNKNVSVEGYTASGSELENEEEEDGIREALEMEWEMTRDLKLGFVPRTRLVSAYNQLLEARRKGTQARTTSGITWQERGPNVTTVGPSNGNFRGPQNNASTGGRMRAIWLDLNDPSGKTVWAGSVSGGLWKTNDISANPANWINVNDFLGNLAVTSITQNPAQKNILYFGTGERNGNFDAVRGGGVWKSIDNGATWNLLPNTVGFINISKIVCDAAGNLYVGTNGNGTGLQRSKNGGLTWENITPATTGNGSRISELRVSSSGRMHVTLSGGNTSNSGYFYTDDPANVVRNSWVPPLTSFPNIENNCELSVTGDVLYALPSNSSFQTPQIYKSLDGGNVWFATPSSPPTSGTSGISNGQGWFNLAIGADPRNPDNVIAGGLNFYRSSDGGATWVQLSQWVGTTFNYVHADHHAVVWNNDQVLTATDGGIFYSANNAVSFVDRNVGLRTKQFYACAIHPTLTNYFLGGTQDNGTHQFSQAGLGSTVEVQGGDGGYCHIDEDEPQFQFGATIRAQYRKSTNGGSSWSQVNYSTSVGIFINPTEYDDVENVMYTSAEAGGYVRWENPQTGNTFTPVSLTSTNAGAARSFCVSRNTRNRLFVGFENGRIFRVDNAKSGSPTAINISGTTLPGGVVSCINTGSSDLQLIATYSNYGNPHVWISRTGGGSSGWINVNGNLPDIPVRWAMFFPEDDNKALIATEMGVYETAQLDGSSTVWVPSTGFPTVKTNMLQYRSSDRTILAATHGRGFWTAQMPSSNPIVRFPSSVLYGAKINETNAAVDNCRRYRDYQIPIAIDAAPNGNAVVTIDVDAGSIAKRGADFDFSSTGDFVNPSSDILFPSGSTASRTFTLRIYDDASVEDEETFTLKLSVSGSTDARASLTYGRYVYTIIDNDVAPLPSSFSGTSTIGFYDANISVTSPFRSNVARNRVQYLYTANELNAAGIGGACFISSLNFNVAQKNSTRPFNGFTISMGTTSATNLNAGYLSVPFTQVFSANYSTVGGSNLINFSNPFYWNGTSNVVLNICFDNPTGNPDALADLVAGTQTPLGSGNRSVATPSSFSGSGCSISSSSTSDPDTRLLAVFTVNSGNEIATAQGETTTVYVPAGDGQQFLNNLRIIGSISNASSAPGCTTMSIENAGTNWSTFFAGQRSEKVWRVVAEDAAPGFQLSVYVTASELEGRNPSGINIVSTSATTASQASSLNATVYATTFQPFGTGYVFTATVSGAGLFFLSNAFVTGLPNIGEAMPVFVKLMENPVQQTLKLSFTSYSIGASEVFVRSLSSSGQIIESWKLNLPYGQISLPLRSNIYGAGIYFLELIRGRERHVIRFMKQQ